MFVYSQVIRVHRTTHASSCTMQTLHLKGRDRPRRQNVPVKTDNVRRKGETPQTRDCVLALSKNNRSVSQSRWPDHFPHCGYLHARGLSPPPSGKWYHGSPLRSSRMGFTASSDDGFLTCSALFKARESRIQYG